MNTFKKQFAGLTPSAQTRFRRTWGDAPWDHHEYRKLHHRRIWKAELFAAPLPPRWEPERLRPESPLWMALRAKKRRAAKAILKRTDALTRKEAAGCALLTLQWAPDLLGEILDKTPGRPISWLQHC